MVEKAAVLVVDDELSIRESFSLILGKEFKVSTVASGEAALKKIIGEKIDLVYLDIRMPGLNGIETLKRIKEIDPGIEVIMVTAVNDVGSAGSAIKLGAKEYIVKPFDVNDILNKTRSMVIKTQTKAIKPSEKQELIGTSRYIENIKKTIEDVSAKGVNLLITGEKGLEAEEIADIISIDSERPLHVLNISAGLKEQDIFGSEKGSFTAAFEKRTGMLEEASGGILFLRNMELLPMDLQHKLARSLSKKEISREGSFSTIPVDVMVIAETSANLKALIKENAFDQELGSIINQSAIELPPLRRRESDIPILLSHYIEKYGIKYGKGIKFSEAAINILAGYPWPGNMSEMKNTIESLILSSSGEEVSPADLPLDVLTGSAAGEQFVSLDQFQDKLEKAHISNIYDRAGHSMEKAANMLGIPQKSLESKLESIRS